MAAIAKTPVQPEQPTSHHKKSHWKKVLRTIGHTIKEWIVPSHVTWYSWKQTWKDSWVTFLTILGSGAVLIGADFLFGYLIRLAIGG